jgi:hypothetical protein
MSRHLRKRLSIVVSLNNVTEFYAKDIPSLDKRKLALRDVNPIFNEICDSIIFVFHNCDVEFFKEGDTIQMGDTYLPVISPLVAIYKIYMKKDDIPELNSIVKFYDGEILNTSWI